MVARNARRSSGSLPVGRLIGAWARCDKRMAFGTRGDTHTVTSCVYPPRYGLQSSVEMDCAAVARELYPQLTPSPDCHNSPLAVDVLD
jgi:hypothetical protein